ncbi:MAG: hypothetical protein AB3N23_11985 [Paracoccaceae bacterium]
MDFIVVILILLALGGVVLATWEWCRKSDVAPHDLSRDKPTSHQTFAEMERTVEQVRNRSGITEPH